ncbi:unnamed protein product [Camellia sinensis]
MRAPIKGRANALYELAPRNLGNLLQLVSIEPETWREFTPMPQVANWFGIMRLMKINLFKKERSSPVDCGKA